MHKPFVHLHNHSEFSMLDSNNRVEDLAKKAKEYGMPAVGLTDHGNLFGLIYFEDACKKHSIKPIIGCEVYIAPAGRKDRSPIIGDERRYYHMCLYCHNQQGYFNLLKLTSIAYTEGYYYRPRIDDELLMQYHEGLICSSACLAGEISVYLVKGEYEKAKERALFYRDLFGKDYYYLEVQDHGMREDQILRREMKKLSSDTGIPLIATNDVHYMTKEDEVYNDIFICIGTQKKYNDTQRMHASPQCYFRSPDEMYELFADMPEALSNTVELANKCNVTIPRPGPMLPDYEVPKEYDSEETYFDYLVHKGLKNRYHEITPEIIERAEYEIKTIVSMGFVGYFLIVWDFIDWAKSHHISVGPGRGSGAGSVVAYALRITDIDPLKYNLLFERFLNPERISMPDFDIDFSDERRDEVVNYVTEKYGRDNVAGIATYGTLATKAVLKDVARVLDIDYGESNAINKMIPDDAESVADALQKSEELRQVQNRGDVYQKLFEAATRLEGLVRHIGTHACGRVIGRGAVSDYVPLIYDNKTASINTAFESKLIEDCGLVKMDFLGLTTLSVIDRCIAMIHKIDPHFEIEKIPEDDKETFALFSAGDTHGIFQFESNGMQRILKEAKPSSIEDLIALNALYRPGPMQFIPEFIKGKHHPEKVKYIHPSLKEILEPTYGVIVYQEQVMQVAQTFAGYSLGAADLLRRAMGKKKPEEMAQQEEIFVQGAQKLGHNENEAKKLFHILEPFAGYGFNKSHAAAYSVLAYKTCYLKAHYPPEFLAAVLTSQINSPDNFNATLDEVRNLSIKIMPPEINHSGRYFEAEEQHIYYGLQGVKGLGEAVVDEILNERHMHGLFKGFIDFIERVNLQIINKRVLEVLIFAGIFDACETDIDRATLFYNLPRIIDWATRKRNEKNLGNSLFGPEDDTVFPTYEFEKTKTFTHDEKLKMEKEILGFYISGHPLDPYKQYLQIYHCGNLEQFSSQQKTSPVAIFGLVRNIATRTTKRGSLMATAILEDYEGTLNLVFFSRILDEKKHLLEESTPLLIRGSLDFSQGTLQMVVDEITPVTQIEKTKIVQPKIDIQQTQKITPVNIELVLDVTKMTEKDLHGLKKIIIGSQGKSPLSLILEDGLKQTKVICASKYCVQSDDSFIHLLEELPFTKNVRKIDA
ncbi:MAG: DNA polymerase III subunit alpha [Spirochaetia bacterium]